MSKAVLFFAEGTEECEALLVADLLRRAKVEVIIAIAMGRRALVSSHGIHLNADALAEDVDYSDVDMVILPGGIPGTPNLAANKTVTDTCVAFAKAGKKVAAICAAPSVLASLGLLEGKNATAHAGFQDKLAGAHRPDDRSGRGRQHHHQLRSGRCHPVCAGAGAPAGRPGRSRPHPERHRLSALRRRPVPCVLSPAVCPDGVEEPGHPLAGRHARSGPLSWLGLPYETLSDAIPFLTPAGAGRAFAGHRGIPALPIEAVHAGKPHPARRRT